MKIMSKNIETCNNKFHPIFSNTQKRRSKNIDDCSNIFYLKNKRKIRVNDAYKYFITIGLNYISNK
jgi:hypothetical protein